MQAILPMEEKNSNRIIHLSKHLELLAPARDLTTGLVALRAGADAVYIGAPRYGARSAAAVSLADIEELCREAHKQGARIFVALNTVLTDDEIAQSETLIRQLYEAGADALIIQDMGLLELDLPPIPLHASTQCHNSSIEQIALLRDFGFEQIVLPREMSVQQSREIVEHFPSLRFESFIHGALCVSYSGRCYMSQVLQNRSANKGACAQYCRMSYDLLDADGEVLKQNRYLLSLKDLNRSDIIADMVEAGIRSFKIEGRLKSASYVCNVVAFHRQLLDSIIASSGGKYQRSSWGINRINFQPDLERTFHRPYTSFNSPIGSPTNPDIISPFTSKSVGCYMGKLSRVEGKKVVIRSHNRSSIQSKNRSMGERFCSIEHKDTSKQQPLLWNNGDGLFFVDEQGNTDGAFVNGVLGKKLLLSKGITLAEGSKVYKNWDIQFEKLLENPNLTSRILPVDIELVHNQDELRLSIRFENNFLPKGEIQIEKRIEHFYQQAKQDQTQKLREALSKLGGTGFETNEIRISISDCFVPVSLVSALKREVIAQLSLSLANYMLESRDEIGKLLGNLRHQTRKNKMLLLQLGAHLPSRLPYTFNVTNCQAENFYKRLGVEVITPGLESLQETSNREGVALMYTHHCLLNYLGYCTRKGKKPPFSLPLYLRRGNNTFRLHFNCAECQMEIYEE